MRRQVISFALILAMLFSFFYFGNTENTDAKKSSVIKKKITMFVGQKKSIKLKKNTKIKWKSSNKKVATVNKKGDIKAKKVGKTKITAKLSNKKINYIIKVNKRKYTPKQPVQTNQPPVITSTPIPKPVVPTYTPEPTVMPTPKGNIRIAFDVNPNILTKSTKNIYGTMDAYPNTYFVIKVNNKEILKKDYNEASTEYNIEVDFSDYNSGDVIIISRIYDTNKGSGYVMPFGKQFILI